MSRRWRHPSVRRGEFFQPPRSTAAPQPPSLAPQMLRARSRFGLTARRGRFFTAAGSVAFLPLPTRQAGEYRLGARARRGEFLAVPLVATVLPVVQRGAVRARALRVRSGRFVSPPVQVAAPAAPFFSPRLVRGRVRLAALRDGRFASPPLSVVVQPPPSCPPRTVRGRARPAPVRGGAFTCPPWSAPAVAPPPWVPSPVAGRRRALTARRGRFAGSPAAAPIPPPHMSSGRPGASSRRGRFTACPQPLAWIPQPIRARRPSSAPRRGQLFELTWPQAVPPPPPVPVPTVRRGRAAPPMIRIHGRMWPGWMELTESLAPESSAGTMSARDRLAARAVGAERRGTSMANRVRRAAEMEGA